MTDTSQIDWKSLDWDKSNLELMSELGINSVQVSAGRLLYGHGKLCNARYRHIPWRKLDWTKNNQELAIETGVSIQVVQKIRHRLNHPAVNGVYRNRRESAVPEMLATTDWQWERDADIARRFGVSRERVRQIRLEHRLPECLIRGAQNDAETLLAQKWICANRNSLDGRIATEVADECPGNLKIERKYDLLRKWGVKLQYYKHPLPAEAGLPINWELPNQLIELIWNRPKAWASLNRYRWNKVSPKYETRFVGLESALKNPDCVKAIEVEIEKAKAAGIQGQSVTVKALLGETL